METGPSDPPQPRPLRLLSMDGGGIRGISILIIIQEIMHRLQRAEKLATVPLPADYFDLICGTSTGGLIALLLGRLRLSADEAIEAYRTLAKSVFSEKKWRGKDGIFKASNLEKAIKEILVQKLGDGHAEEKMWEDGGTKTFVCAVPARHIKEPRLFRTWSADKNPGYNCQIWEAGRATAAAPLFFKRIRIGDPGLDEEFIDGGIGCNNPIKYLIKEANQEFGADRQVSCIVSIGTGLKRVRELQSPGLFQRAIPVDFLKVLASMATDTQEIAEEVQSRFKNCPGLYYRFNVDRGLEDTILDEWNKLRDVKTCTIAYLEKISVSNDVDQLVRTLSHESPSTFSLGSLDGAIPDMTHTISSTLHAMSTVPFERDSAFVGRKDIVDQLDLIFQSGTRAAIYGLGGIGKSQIAIEYSYRARERKPELWAFWIYAGSQDRFLQAYKDLAVKLKIPGRDDPKSDVRRLVCNWLQNPRNGQWFMILDNVDDSTVLMEPSSATEPALVQYIPQVPHGKILITSRDRVAALDLVGGHDKYLVGAEPMGDNESLELLKIKLSSQTSLEDCRAISQAMEHIPLAMAQACAYINQNKPLMTVSKYLAMFSKSEKNRGILLSHNAADLRRDSNVPNAVITTWELSFTLIKKKYSSSADLLSLMCMFDRQSIPDYLIQKDDDDLAFISALSPLINFSLIKPETGEKSFSIHRLVQLATRTWLETEETIQQWKDLSIQSVSKVFPKGNFENWTLCEYLTPHAEVILNYQPQSKTGQLSRIMILYHTASYLRERGSLTLAEERTRTALLIKSQFQDTKMLRTDYIQQELGSILRSLGEFEESEKLEVQVLDTRRKSLGQDHHETLISISNLALTYLNQGRFKEAEELQVQELETRKRVLGQEHPETLKSIGNLASTYGHQGRFKEAEELQVQVLETHERVLGREHPDTLISISNLALTYLNQGRFKEAEELQVQVLETYKRVLGGEHPDTLISISNLASTYWNQGRFKEAEELQVQVLETRKRVLGQEHPETLKSIGNLASTYGHQGRFKEAEELQVQVLETHERVLGREHPDTLVSINNLASTHLNQGRFKEAEELQVQVLETYKRVLGQEHPNTLISINNLASTYRNQGRFKEAEELQVQVLETRERVLGQEHPNTLISISNLALTYSNQGRFKEAEELQVQVLETHERVLGQEHPNTLVNISNLALTYWNQERFKEAEELQVQELETHKRVLGQEHPDTLKSINNLALTYWNQGRFKEAEELQVQVLETRKRVLGQEHPHTLTSMSNLAVTWRDQDRDEDAVQLMDQCANLRQKVLGIDHPYTKASLECLEKWRS